MSTMSYAHPEVLVDTQWVEDHLKDSNARIAEVDYDPKANYQLGHVPGAVLFDWRQDINDPVSRNVLSKQAYEDLLQRAGVNNDTTLVLYGDFNNWFAAFAFWVFKYYGFKDVRIMNRGRKKWLEEDREVNKDIPNHPKGNLKATDPDKNIRVFLDEVKQSLDAKDRIRMVDVRSPKEFTGEILAPPEYPTEHAQRGGHIPGAENIPWAQAVNDKDGTFKSADELKKLYESKGITPDKVKFTIGAFTYFYKEGRPYLKRMNNKAILLATIAILAVSSFLLIGGMGTQTAEAGTSPGCNHGAATTIDPNAPNAVKTNTPATTQPTI